MVSTIQPIKMDGILAETSVLRYIFEIPPDTSKITHFLLTVQFEKDDPWYEIYSKSDPRPGHLFSHMAFIYDKIYNISHNNIFIESIDPDSHELTIKISVENIFDEDIFTCFAKKHATAFLNVKLSLHDYYIKHIHCVKATCVSVF